MQTNGWVLGTIAALLVLGSVGLILWARSKRTKAAAPSEPPIDLPIGIEMLDAMSSTPHRFEVWVFDGTKFRDDWDSWINATNYPTLRDGHRKYLCGATLRNDLVTHFFVFGPVMELAGFGDDNAYRHEQLPPKAGHFHVDEPTTRKPEMVDGGGAAWFDGATLILGDESATYGRPERMLTNRSSLNYLGEIMGRNVKVVEYLPRP